MSKQPEYHKYNPLEDWFRSQDANMMQVTLTFAEIEKIIGEKLPKSASKLKTWWTNVIPEVMSPRTAWLRPGWEVESADQVNGIVRFKRNV